MRIVVVAKLVGGYSGIRVYRFEENEEAEGFAKDVRERADRLASIAGIIPDHVYVLDPDDARHFNDPEEMREWIKDSKRWAL